jgi:hypothetical protein
MDAFQNKECANETPSPKTYGEEIGRYLKCLWFLLSDCSMQLHTFVVAVMNFRVP